MLIQFGRLRALLASVALALPAAALCQAMPSAPPEPVIITIDPLRLNQHLNMPVTVRVTVPRDGASIGLVVLSHGNQLSRSDYAPLVRYLASHGYAVVQPDHPDASVDGLMGATAQPADLWSIRARQLQWIAEHFDTLIQAVPLLEGRVDISRIAVIGHSFGGQSAALVMGARSKASEQRFDSPLYRAAILLAPPGNFDGLTSAWQQRAPYLAMDWSSMRGPVLTINGSADMTPLTERGAQWHNDVWTQSEAGRAHCLMVVEGAGHSLGGIDSFLRLPQGDATLERRQRVFSTVVAFLDAALSPSGRIGPSLAPDIRCK